MTRFITRFAEDESGATAIEYGLIAALIALVIISAVRALGNEVTRPFSRLQDEM
jgi:pilus assembly protein Flp/PilA